MKKFSKIITGFVLAFTLTGTTAFASENIQSSNQVASTSNAVTYYYTLKIKTADVANAGTDANISVILQGANGISDSVSLDTPGYNDFERNSTYTYAVSSNINLGAINNIKIFHDGSGGNASWMVGSIEVSQGSTLLKTFNINTWLGTDGSASNYTFYN